MASSFAQSFMKLKLDYKTDKVPGREMGEIKGEAKAILGKSGDVTFHKLQRYTNQQKIYPYLTYGTLAGIWNFAPASKSFSDLGVGGHKPWYFNLHR